LNGLFRPSSTKDIINLVSLGTIPSKNMETSLSNTVQEMIPSIKILIQTPMAFLVVLLKAKRATNLNGVIDHLSFMQTQQIKLEEGFITPRPNFLSNTIEQLKTV